MERVGLPECQLNLSQAVCYLATAPEVERLLRWRSAAARKDVKEGRTLPVPEAPARLALPRGEGAFGHGAGYQYAHDHEGGWVDQEYVPADVEYYHPTDRGFEAAIRRGWPSCGSGSGSRTARETLDERLPPSAQTFVGSSTVKPGP